jgi:hypothetical protein
MVTLEMGVAIEAKIKIIARVIRSSSRVTPF